MSVYVGHPALKDGVPPLTQKQDERLSAWLDEIRSNLELHLPGRHALAWTIQDEYRPGRGHDIEAVAMDGEHVAWLFMDPYGNGHDGYGKITLGHNGADDECACGDCEAFRDDD